MVAQLRTRQRVAHIDVTIGDFATAKVGGAFTLAHG
jgi:hypothetical protein